MLVNFKTSMFKSFEEIVELDLKACKGINVHQKKDMNILKTSIIYGSNNSGKSNFINAVKMMKTIVKKGSLKGFPFKVYKNFFFEKPPLSFEVEFLTEKFDYVYGLDLYSESNIGEYLVINDKPAFSRGGIKEKPYINKKDFPNGILRDSFDYLNDSELFVTKALSYNEKAKNKHIRNINMFFNKLKFYDNNGREKYIDLIISCLENEKKSKLFNEILSRADISLSGQKITSGIGISTLKDEDIIKEIKSNKDIKDNDIEDLLKTLRIKSIYKRKNIEVEVPTFYDSIGTNKFSTLLLLIMDCVENGNILFIDEIDNSLHYRLTRELIKLMNSEVNNNAQFIMTAHDIKLLTPLIFRKEQVNFIERTADGVDIFSLGDFPEVRNVTNYENLYTKNSVGALPKPDFDEVIKLWQEN